jgi:hypothetical protein
MKEAINFSSEAIQSTIHKAGRVRIRHFKTPKYCS